MTESHGFHSNPLNRCSNDIPLHDTFNRVFRAIDFDQFLEGFVRWVQATCITLAGEQVAIDGKALRSVWLSCMCRDRRSLDNWVG